ADRHIHRSPDEVHRISVGRVVDQRRTADRPHVQDAGEADRAVDVVGVVDAAFRLLGHCGDVAAQVGVEVVAGKTRITSRGEGELRVDADVELVDIGAADVEVGGARGGQLQIAANRHSAGGGVAEVGVGGAGGRVDRAPACEKFHVDRA